jgi:hypothetical protein
MFILSLSAYANAQFYGINPIPQNFECIPPESNVEIQDIPQTVSQAIGFCDAAVAATLMEKDSCRIRKIICSNLTADQRISLLYLMRFNHAIESESDRAIRENYDKINVGAPGSAAVIMANFVASSNRAVKESCAPFDAFVSKDKTVDEQVKTELDMWEHLKNVYLKSKDGSEKCLLCLATATATELHEKYKSKVTNAEVLAAFGEKTYEEFLARVLVPEECMSPTKQLLWRPSGAFRKWPANQSEMKIETAFEKIQTNLKKGQIMGLQEICLDKQYTNGSCKSKHHVVVNGFCPKMCDKNNPTNCKKNAVKIQNSWGQTWQDENHDGWVEGETLLKRTDFKNAEKATLFWIEDNQ